MRTTETSVSCRARKIAVLIHELQDNGIEVSTDDSGLTILFRGLVRNRKLTKGTCKDTITHNENLTRVRSIANQSVTFKIAV